MAHSDSVSLPKAAAVVVAAGSSERMQLGPGERKPFLMLAGRTVLEHSCEALCAAEQVCELVLVVRDEDIRRVEELARGNSALRKLSAIVPGGKERSDSVRAGVLAASESRDLVAVHDAARPLISTEVVERALRCAAEKGAALVAVPLRDTIKRCDESTHGDAAPRAVETLDRSRLWAAQTPQVFWREPFLALLDRALAEGFAPTDDAALYERFVGPIPLVLGDPTNFKLTTPLDLELAVAWLRAREGSAKNL